ncbi:MAG: hypothetical protein IJK52_13590 [Oscillospiraceae bacterium]|nr:hypothetical protein [Oscillospiraceae bacterium]
MSASKSYLLQATQEITVAALKGGNFAGNVDVMQTAEFMQSVYDKLKELSDDVKTNPPPTV